MNKRDNKTMNSFSSIFYFSSGKTLDETICLSHCNSGACLSNLHQSNTEHHDTLL